MDWRLFVEQILAGSIPVMRPFSLLALEMERCEIPLRFDNTVEFRDRVGTIASERPHDGNRNFHFEERIKLGM